MRLLSEGKLPGLMSSLCRKSDAKGGVDDKLGSKACEHKKHTGINQEIERFGRFWSETSFTPAWFGKTWAHK